MDHLSDYIQWMGDFPISLTGFQDADALVLAALSYFDFSPLIPDPAQSLKISGCLEAACAGRLRVMITGGDDGYTELLELAARSKRYGSLSIASYQDIFRHDPPLQFSAVCFHDESDLSVLAFRGTDNTLAGWKEDMMISFTRTEAQWMALRYAEQAVSGGRRWILCGHSKGANLALYAACLLSEEKREAVERLYLLDGPGFCPEVLSLSLIGRIAGKAVVIRPRFCVVGKFFSPDLPDTRIVQSSASGLLQHALVSWGIDHGKLALSSDHDPGSVLLSEALNEWAVNIPHPDRKVLVDELFRALSASGAVTIDDLQSVGIDGLEAIYHDFSSSSTMTKLTLSGLPLYAVRARADLLRKKLGAEIEKRRKKQQQPVGEEEEDRS